MRKIIMSVMVATLLVTAFCGFASAKTFMSIATGGTSGTYYPIGGGMADIVSKYSKELQVTAETGNASAANCNLISTHDIELAIVQNNVAAWAFNGEFMFENKAIKNLRGVASLYPETVHLVATKSSGIKTLADLKGKRVSVGAPGSGVEADVRTIFKLAGLQYSDAKVDFLDFANSVDRMKDGQLDAAFITAGFPVAAIMDVALTSDIELVSFDEKFLDELHAKFPYYVKAVIPAGTYKGVDHDTSTPTTMAILVGDEQVPEEAVYDFVKTMWENIKDIENVHAKAKLIKKETALDGIGIPLHPGAEKYYKEIGLIK